MLREFLRLQNTGSVPTDVVLHCEGGDVHAHGLLLAAVSPVLRAALEPGATDEVSRTVELPLHEDTVERVLCWAFSAPTGGALRW